MYEPKNPTRAEIAIEHTWDLDVIFESVEEWETAVSTIPEEIKKIESFKGKLSDGADSLLNYFKATEELYRLVGKIYVYASLNYSVETSNQEVASRHGQARAIFGQVSAATSFGQPELIVIGFDTLKSWMDENPKLASYRHYFDQLEIQQKHVRSAEVEQLLGMVQDSFATASATHGILANTDFQFDTAVDKDGNEYDITQGSISGLYNEHDRELRRSAWENYQDRHLQYKNSMANALAAGVKQNVFKARVRGYSSALDAAMQSSFIPEEVFHNLVKTFKKNIPTWHKYWDIRRHALGYDSLHEYDIWAPLSRNKPVVPYQKAVRWIAEGMQPLGDDYVSMLKQGAIEKRWVDIYPNQGKRMGAFSSGVPGTHPYIMVSYTDDLFGLSTLAHELGHSMHSYLTWQNQPLLAYCNYGLFVAEVASNFNQALVRDYLFKTQTDPEFQIAIIEEAMANFYRYFFIMPTLARFELSIHQEVEKGNSLSADYLIELLSGYYQEGYGSSLTMDRERSGIIWATFHSHLYANFYV